tara:strand:- start:51 stop:392 length:342 start_codon:yes stop_codon:yes gene_type:complete
MEWIVTCAGKTLDLAAMSGEEMRGALQKMSKEEQWEFLLKCREKQALQYAKEAHRDHRISGSAHDDRYFDAMLQRACRDIERENDSDSVKECRKLMTESAIDSVRDKWVRRCR